MREQDTQRVASLARGLGVSPIVAALLISRDCDDELSARSFLHLSCDQLHKPYLMLGMGEAVSRLLRAINNSEHILVSGDYDVDGARHGCSPPLSLPGAQTGFHAIRFR